jgi:hypothetical protein
VLSPKADGRKPLFGCGKLCEINLGGDAFLVVFARVESGKILVSRGTPSPHPSECFDWRGVRKNGLQNLERLRVRGQNLERLRFEVKILRTRELRPCLGFLRIPPPP